ncbi:PQQ-binding-like beta-propeller repeat protein [Streptomyces sp. NPDC051569]|uniref:outer membrane protein assembly factor BamB family protein n=1 Tax=Streptomyces sp. NPDC051569 TaxID=3365661 RepID=UPI003790D665
MTQPPGQQSPPTPPGAMPPARPGPYHQQRRPSPPHTGREARAGRSRRVLAATVAALLAVGGGTWLLLGGGAAGGEAGGGPEAVSTGRSEDAGRDPDTGRTAGESTVWMVKNDVGLPDGGADAFGPWVVGDTVAQAMDRQIVGYSTADGKKKWTLPLPARACAATDTPTADGEITIGILNGPADKGECGVLRSVDLTTGTFGWKKELPHKGSFDIGPRIALTHSGGTVVAARRGGTDAYRISDGADLFHTDARDAGEPAACTPYAYAGGSRLIAAEHCPAPGPDSSSGSGSGSGSETVDQLAELDPVTGRARWTYRLTKDREIDKVYSVDPLIVSVTNRQKNSWTVVAIDADGILRSQLDGGQDKFSPTCAGNPVIGGQNLEGCTGVAADTDTFYMSTTPTEGTTSATSATPATPATPATNEIVAFDLDTGKPRWRSRASDDREMTPLRVEGGKVLVYLEATAGRGGAIATLAASGGAPKVIQQHPASTAAVESSFFSPRPAYADGRFYLAGGRVLATGHGAGERETPTMMAFGE